MNPVLECLFNHKSIRKYKDQPLEDEKLKLIIEAAQRAPTWCNGEQVSIIAIKDKERKKIFENLCWGQKHISECSVFLIFCADFYRVSLAFEKEGKNEEFKKYIAQFDPILIGSHDVGIAIQNAVVAAESLGLGTVDIGAIRTKIKEVTKELNLPKYVIPMIGLCVGYPDDNPGLKPRIPMKGVFFEEKYDTEKVKAGVDEYDEIFKKYLAERDSNSRDSNWSKSISNTYIKITGLNDEECELITKQGFYPIKK
jgi:FMN reductase [NAD(P)H]